MTSKDLLDKAKEMCYAKFAQELNFLNSRPKCKTYGYLYTKELVWSKLPEASKTYWHNQAVSENA